MTESQRHSTPPGRARIDIYELAHVVWAGKWLIGGITLVSAVIAVVVSLMLPNIYRAEALLAPNNKDNTGGLSALAAQYGGLAALAGIDISGGDVDKTALGLEILQSRKFISDFIQRHDILVPLMAADGWDRATDQLEIDSDLYDPTAGAWVRRVRPPKTTVPSSQEAYRAFMEIVSVNRNTKTGFVTVAIQHYSPNVAKQWTDWLIDDLNANVMQQDVREAEYAIEYLNKQIENTALAGLQSIFFRLIEEQTKTVMLAKMSSEYLLKTLDPAVAPERKFKPKRILIVLFATLLGGFLGVLIQLVRFSKEMPREESV